MSSTTFSPPEQGPLITNSSEIIKNFLRLGDIDLDQKISPELTKSIAQNLKDVAYLEETKNLSIPQEKLDLKKAIESGDRELIEEKQAIIAHKIAEVKKLPLGTKGLDQKW